MDTITRNHIFMEHIDLINRTLRRHRLLLYALHLELDDVYQELAIAALQAIDTFDDRRRERRLRQALARLEPQERRAVLDYLEGMKPARKAEKNNFDAALEKLRAFYLSAYRTTQFGL